MSQETQAARWIGFRQPILRVALEKQGKKFNTTYEAHEAAGIGQVWEEDEFWIELSWRVDPDGSLGIRKYFESPYEPGKKMTVDDYYRWIFENSVPGLPEAAAKQGLKPLEYMRKYGAFLIEDNVYKVHETGIKSSELLDTATDPSSKLISKNGDALGVEVDGKACVGFPTPSRKLEFFSKTLKDWKWPEHAIPGYIKSHVHPDNIDLNAGEMLLLPDISFADLDSYAVGERQVAVRNIQPQPALDQFERRRESRGQDRRSAQGPHRDRLLHRQSLGDRRNQAGSRCLLAPPWPLALGRRSGRRALVDGAGRFETDGRGQVDDATVHGIKPFKSDDPDSERIFWEDGGVHQNLTFPVQPDFISGQHCWHQKVRDDQAGAGGQIRRHLCRHQQVARSVQKMAIENPPGAWPG